MNWMDIYRRRVTTADEAVTAIESGHRVWIHPGCCTPVLVDAMVKRAPDLRDVEVVHILTLADAPYVNPGMEDHFRHIALFTGGNVRQAVNEGRADFVPIHLHEVAELITSGVMPAAGGPDPRVAAGRTRVLLLRGRRRCDQDRGGARRRRHRPGQSTDAPHPG
jgi:acyl-CoA hydrolase